MAAVDWALFFYFVPNSPDNSTKLDSRAKRARDEVVRLAGKYPKDLRIAYRLALSDANPAKRVVLDPNRIIEEDEDTVYDPGDPEPFKKFFGWAHNKGCRGKRCAVFLWGHGFGPAGLFSLEDLIDLGVANTAAPITLPTLPQLPGPTIGPSPTTSSARKVYTIPSVSLPGLSPGPTAPSAVATAPAASVGSFVQLTGVTLGQRAGVVQRNDGVKIKFPPQALIQHEGAALVRVPPPRRVSNSRNRALAEVPPTPFVVATPGPVRLEPVSTINLASALAGLRKLRKKPTDVVLFQCCWVSGLEYARQLRGEAKAMVASQTLLPMQKDPWPYEKLLDTLRASRGSNQSDLHRVVKKLVGTLSDWHNRQKQKRPITGLNLNDNTLPKAFERLVKALKKDAQGQPLNLEHLYSNAKTRDRSKGLYKNENSGLIDVLRLCGELEASTHGDDVKRAAKRLANIVKKNVIIAHLTPDEDLYRGVTVYYHPSPKTEARLDNSAHIEFLQEGEYRFFSFSRTKWTEFAFELQA